MINSMANDNKIDLSLPIEDLTDKQIDILLHGTGPDRLYSFEYTNMMGQTKTHKVAYEGLINLMQRRYKETQSDGAREEYKDI
jgi:excinuclease ABC subunit A